MDLHDFLTVDVGETGWVVFRLDSYSYAVSLHNVVEVLPLVAMTPLPEAPTWFTGVINVRGQAVPVIDLRVRLGLPAKEPDLKTQILLSEVGSRSLGLMVDSVDDVVDIPAESIEQPDELAGNRHAIKGIARREGSLILILDIQRLADKEIFDFTAPDSMDLIA